MYIAEISSGKSTQETATIILENPGALLKMPPHQQEIESKWSREITALSCVGSPLDGQVPWFSCSPLLPPLALPHPSPPTCYRCNFPTR